LKLNHTTKEYVPKVYVDCANGVGAAWVGLYTCKLTKPVIEVEMYNYNTTKHESLNRAVSTRLNHYEITLLFSVVPIL
jgi:hypothetical protein